MNRRLLVIAASLAALGVSCYQYSDPSDIFFPSEEDSSSSFVDALPTSDESAQADLQPPPDPESPVSDSSAPALGGRLRSVTAADREAAAARAAALRESARGKNVSQAMMPMPGGTPDYLGMYPNYANSPVPTVDPITGVVSGGIRKFVNTLPGLGPANANNLGQYIPVAISNTTAYPGSDYYQIGLVDYAQQLHSDIPATRLRGYIDLAPGADGRAHYLGPMIVAQTGRPVRVKFTNMLGLGAAGNLFLPVDPTVMGAGMGPTAMLMPNGTPMLNADGTPMMESYTQNRAVVHLHGGDTPWISDGTPHQWITPAGENTSYHKGVSQKNVPDMPDPGPGSATHYFPNGKSARFLWYHDHAYGMTRLNVYAGEAAGYLLTDTVEESLISTKKVLPDLGGLYHCGIPLIIQDKTFVDVARIGAQDPTWNWGTTPPTPHAGDLWFPHVYMPNQNPGDAAGVNAMGRWDYGPWFWPPVTAAAGLLHPPIPSSVPGGPEVPSIPNPSMVMEAFMDTPIVNGTAYPVLPVARRAYRFRILNACDDRYLNLQLYYADPNAPTEVKMVAAVPHGAGFVDPDDVTPENRIPACAPGVTVGAATAALPTGCWPETWPTDGREGGVPDPTTAGPSMIQIGTEGGFLPAPVVLDNTPVGYNYNRRDIVVLNVATHTLFLGPAERADVIVDFSGVPDGSKLILYNDAPAPVPAFDPRYDYYTGDPDQTSTGGAPTTLAGYGPNTRTMMQFQVTGATAAAPFDLAALQIALPVAYAASQDRPLVPQSVYGPAFGTTYTDTYSGIQDTSLTLRPAGPAPLATITLTAPGTGYTTAPGVTFVGGGGTGATATTTVARVVNTITLTKAGSGYLTAPAVALTGGGGSGATANATISGIVTAIGVTNGGTAYTSAPAVAITGGGGAGAAATAAINGAVNAITLSSAGTGYSFAPTVALTGGGGTGASATATTTGIITAVTVTRGGTGYTSVPTVALNGGGGTGATAVATISNGAVTGITVTSGGTGYNAAPTVAITGGGGRNAAATAQRTNIVTAVAVKKGGSGYTSAPTVVFTGGGGTGAAATATILGPVSAITVTNGGGGYTTVPTVALTGGGGTGAVAAATITNVVNAITITNGGTGYTSAPIVAITGGGGTGAAATATVAGIVTSITLTNGGAGYTSAPTVVIAGAGGTGAAATASTATILPMQAKAIQELFELEYGRMNATFGVEMPLTNFNTQTTIPYGYIDPPTEIIKNGETQVWKITHNGVDTHAVHFHLFNVQLVNRVGWDGAIRPPDDNELGWKETVRMNPLEDAIVALRPIVPLVPFRVPDSIRPLNPTMPLGSTMGFSRADPQNQPVTVVNEMTNFGWEYMWHCHLLSHEEMDMMRPIVFQVPPGAPIGIVATPGNALAFVSFATQSAKSPPARSIANTAEGYEDLAEPGSTGGSEITSYTVTAEPGGITATGTTSPITVIGLTNGVAYTFTVTATNAVGTSSPSTPSDAVTPDAAIGLAPVLPMCGLGTVPAMLMSLLGIALMRLRR